jgi:hypothetical protein
MWRVEQFRFVRRAIYLFVLVVRVVLFVVSANSSPFGIDANGLVALIQFVET